MTKSDYGWLVTFTILSFIYTVVSRAPIMEMFVLVTFIWVVSYVSDNLKDEDD